ncbi:hypothetical protein Ddye_022949 [Dipteronia dyeriana]|uniref:Disease resistance R13L4/SHOC-2-like LRR domain-containing protein n=1 Tax=Dipteronia dyeriana TaxID=168575 RepID=A0AAD9TS63_9ROSI|nr:hypothetical protein Ddye_022949 [Dipteronia dyeriana]
MALNMSYFGLTGTIPPQLGNLSFLTLVDIKNNSFHGSLPKELSRLCRLKFIDFTSNNFNTEIASWLASLPKLQHLILNQNSFKGTIPPFLGNISSLQELRLTDNKLSGGVPKELGNLAQLEILSIGTNSLRGNNLTGNLADNMCQNLPALQGLYMSGNQFTGRIPNNLWQCRHLRFVSLSFNQFGGRIPRDIGNLTFAIALAIGYNNLTATKCHCIGKAKEEEDTGAERQAMSMHFLTGCLNPESMTIRTIATAVHHHKGTMEGINGDRKSLAQGEPVRGNPKITTRMANIKTTRTARPPMEE